MRSMIMAAAAAGAMALTGCQSVDRDVAIPAGIGALGGAAIGAGISGDAGGALAGAAIGGAGGALLGAATSRRGDCVYRDGRGQRYTAACPRGYRY